jgi:hypothetical protein
MTRDQREREHLLKYAEAIDGGEMSVDNKLRREF